MALQVKTKSPTYDITISIDNEPVRLHIKRLTRAEIIPFRKEVAKHERRGSAQVSEDERDTQQHEARVFAEQCIRDYVTIEPGDVTTEDGDVVSGEQILQAFYNRQDVLNALASALYAENCVGDEQKKTLRSRGVFSPGSKPPTNIPAGGAPGSIAERAAPLATASDAGVTASAGASQSGSSAA